MAKDVRKDFCTHCRRQTEYTLKKRQITQIIRNEEYHFLITTAVCNECGSDMSIPGLIDKNVKEIDDQYRLKEGIVSIEDIENLMSLYNIGKAPLSLALGFGEITVTRYLLGQIPSKEYSDIMKKALTSPAYMKQRLMVNREKIADSAFQKAYMAANSLENLFSVSSKMLGAIEYIFEKLEEVTPLTLQKLLYYIQGIYLALYDNTMFSEHCEAWVHGPVFPEVYFLFSNFKYNPIEDVRFAILDGTKNVLSESEREVIDIVVSTFGLYGGKILENITHNEMPWIEARKGLCDDTPSNEVISEESMKDYFKSVNEKYDFTSKEGISRYIQSMICV